MTVWPTQFKHHDFGLRPYAEHCFTAECSGRDKPDFKLLISEIFFSSPFFPMEKHLWRQVHKDYQQYRRYGIYRRLAFVFQPQFHLSTTGARWIYRNFPLKLVLTLFISSGSGNENPVEKGASIILAVDAQDYSANGGCNLSIADFEFNDVNDIYPDTENPDVADMLLWFKSSATITTLHGRALNLMLS